MGKTSARKDCKELRGGTFHFEGECLPFREKGNEKLIKWVEV